jgi:phosphopantothenoylcysteine decarboxylase/phosphopantothenate--cysteine ligase
MKPLLDGKTILLGVSGSIAVYKTVDWARSLRRDGAVVQTVMTEAATRFVAPLTFAALTGNPVCTDLFNEADAHQIHHISLARQADCILLAPTTATTLARLAHGLADNLLSAIVMATTAPVIICPAMNTNMLRHPATQANLATLRRFGYQIIEPESGLMACGEEGPGRLPEWDQVREAVLANLSPQDLAGKIVLVSAGPTREHLDPARFLSNRSTGKMGFALARTARRRGAQVILVSGPTHLAPPPAIDTVMVETAEEMEQVIQTHAKKADVVVMAAAVADHRPASQAMAKLKKQAMAPALSLEPTVDILLTLGKQKKKSGRPAVLVGFAAESVALAKEGVRKLQAKNLDLIAVNDIGHADRGFAADTNQVLLLDRSGNSRQLPLLGKEETADHIWDAVVALFPD